MNMLRCMKIISVVLFLTLTSFVNAQNLVVNGFFDSNIDGWNFNSNLANWVSDEGASISGNGSFRFGKIISNNGFRWSASEPMTVSPGFTYEVAVSAKRPIVSAANFASLILYWYDNNDVLISQDFLDSGIIPFPTEVWVDMYGAYPAPEESAYAIIWLTLSVGEGGSPDEAFVLWDDVFMLEDSLFISGFE